SACTTKASAALPSFGLISGSNGAWHPDGPKEGLKKIAEWGYSDLEGGGVRDMPPSEYLDLLKSLGLKAVIGSCPMANIIDEEKLLSTIKRAQSLEQPYLACYWPWLAESKGDTIDGWKEVADNLNKGAYICKNEGITLIYHNHDMEFYPVDGQMPFDVIMSLLDPSIHIELDLYWITKSGQSALDYIRKYPGRYPVFHLKDMPANIQCGQGLTDFSKLTEADFAPIGSGIVDFPAIFKLNSIAGAKHFTVESDKPGDMATFLELSGKYLRNLRF
ncbi:MAG: sugar phosphate isomerase/epimerase, partial [Tannerella sp.]|nr:sugar phosphate isomerase/epimerase [Tannerella sp.]